jgi:two-component system sensor histidine kinase BaeS
MGAAPRRSLFWTFAGVFLLVLAIATALQIVLSVAVFRPLALRSDRDRAAQALASAADALFALDDPGDGREVMRALHEHRVAGVEAILVFIPENGRWIPERPMPPPMLRQIGDLAVAAGLVPPDERGPFAPRGGPPPDAPGGAFADPQGPPDGPGPEPRPDDAPPFQPRDRRLIVLAHRPVVSGARTLGTLAAIGVAPSSSLGSSPEARALFLFMPLAVIAAGVAGLLMVRIMVRRLRALEAVASRVTAGDLTARVETTGRDEIGLLEERFNRMTERLGAAREQLAETDRQRRRLLADITHELATPLTSIRGYVETLLDPAVPLSAEEPKQYLSDVLEESKRMDLLLRDLLDLARLEAGAQPLACERLDWAALCRNTVRRFEPRFRAARLDLAWSDHGGEAWVSADGRRMEQVVENLLVNALRYVPPGGAVACDLAPIDGDRRGWRLTVRDNGPGIAPDDLPHVFDRFYRARHVRETSGSGLGLAIVREIVVQHGGAVRAEAGVPRGAAFVVDLPPPPG